MEDFLYKNESYQIRGACFWVWKAFGSAFKESIIERALLKELQDRGLKIERQKRIDLYYKGVKVGTYIPDFVINECIVVELKCKPRISREDELQFWRYLTGTNYKLGFLINFGTQLEIKRRIYDKARPQPQ